MLKRIGAEESGEFKAIASGTLSSGKPVVVNSDGTVSVVSTTTLTEAKGSNVEFESGAARNQDVVYDSNSDRVVICYKDENNSNFGTAIVGTVSGDSISFGTPVVYQSSNSDTQAAVFDSTNNKVVVAFRDAGDSNKGKAAVGTVDPSDNSISFGSAVQFEAGNTQHTAISFDSSAGKVVIAYKDNSDSGIGRAIVGTVSGTSISFGSANAFQGLSTSHITIAYDVANNKHVIGYAISGSGQAKVGTVSGTSISFGSATEFEAGATILTAAVYDPNIERVHIFYADGGDSDKGKAVIGSVSGTSISFTGQSTFYDSAQVTNIGVSFNSSINKITVSTKDNGGALNMFTTSATTSAFTHGSAFAIDASITTGEVRHAHVSTANKTVLAFTDGGDSSKGKAVVYTGAGDVKNLTSENYIGIARGAVSQSTISQSAGTPVTFNSGSPRVTDIAYDTNSDRVVIVYRDDGNSGHGTAIVGTVSGTSISFGTEVVFNAAETKFPQISYDTNAQKVLVTYQDEGNSNYGTAIVGTVDSSDNSISFGSETVFKSAATSSQASVYDPDSQKVIIAFSVGSAQPQAAVATISGTSVSFGSLASFAGTNDAGLAMAYDTDTNRVVIAYRDGSDVQGKSVVGTVSGTSISFGSEVVYESSGVDSFLDITYDASAQKIVIAFLATGDVGKAIVGTVSGTSISYGTAVTYDTVASDHNAIEYDPTAESVALFYRDTTPFHGKAVSGKVSGTSITFGDQITFQSGRAERMAAVYDPDSAKVIVAYHDYAASTGDAVVFTTGYVATNRVSTANGSRTSIDIIGSVVDNQLSLTAGQQYFVQNDGTISETADSPSVLAGTAISATELLVKT